MTISTMMDLSPGALMRSEAAEAAEVFARAATQDLGSTLAPLGLQGPPRHFYTIARGSSDAAANVLSYEFMRVLRRPMTSLPPSVFSIGEGVAMTDALALLISQSGASDDLARSARGVREQGGRVLALTNVPGSAVEAEADATLSIGAGPERAVPATKTVIGSIGAGAAVLAAFAPAYRAALEQGATGLLGIGRMDWPERARIEAALAASSHIYVIGRGTGFGAAQEIALKLKECCALHAESYSASEVLHGPLQLATKAMTALVLDTGQPETRSGIDLAADRLAAAGAQVFRLDLTALTGVPLAPAAAAAGLLHLSYPIVLSVALGLGLNPDSPNALSKVTQTT